MNIFLFFQISIQWFLIKQKKKRGVELVRVGIMCKMGWWYIIILIHILNTPLHITKLTQIFNKTKINTLFKLHTLHTHTIRIRHSTSYIKYKYPYQVRLCNKVRRRLRSAFSVLCDDDDLRITNYNDFMIYELWKKRTWERESFWIEMEFY